VRIHESAGGRPVARGHAIAYPRTILSASSARA
jgi:hypothetical protein